MQVNGDWGHNPVSVTMSTAHIVMGDTVILKWRDLLKGKE